MKLSFLLNVWYDLSLDLSFDPLNPYLKGRIAEYLRVVVQPKELRLPPIGDNPSDGITLSEDEAEFLEYTLFRGWMQQWLKWVQWYAEVALD